MKSFHWSFLVCLSFVFAPAILSGQQVIEMSTDIVQEGDGEQMRIMSFSTSDGFDMNGPAIMMASPGLNGSFSFGGADQFGLLGNSNVQTELDLVDEQIERIQEVKDKFNEKMSEVTRQIRGDNGRLNLDPAMIDKLRTLSQEIQEQKREEMEGLLLPEQLERLKQVALQMKMKQQGAVNALGGKEVAEALGLSEEQLEELKEKSKELSERVKKEIEAAKEKARKELIAELTSDQQEKLKALMGDKFEQDKPDSSRRQ